MGSYRLAWEPLLGGHLAIGPKPGRKTRDLLQQQGCTLVVSLLSHSESTQNESEQLARLPLASADPPGADRDPEVLALFDKMISALGRGGRLYLHCSAGLHRTGMLTYAFLRFLGRSETEAIDLITKMRALTADELKPHRQQWGERFASRAP